MPGAHNVLNCLATIAVADELEVPLDVTKQALASFSGVARRFTIVGEAGGVTLVDDYGHHPAEIAPRSTPRGARTRARTTASWWRSSRTATAARATCSTTSRAPSTRPTSC
jgi:UDP-N-acetylmuramate-alanine ligase